MSDLKEKQRRKSYLRKKNHNKSMNERISNRTGLMVNIEHQAFPKKKLFKSKKKK